MSVSRFFEWFAFAVLACWGLLGLTRATMFHARGISVIAADRQRTLSQLLLDALAAVCLLVWAWEVIASAWRLEFHVGPAALQRVLVESIAVRAVGAVVASSALLLYAVALRSLGESWRLGIDRTTPGPLITSGVYRWTRHPIYVAFDLLFLATFLILGRLNFLVLALVWIPLMHILMLREERFLAERYGGAYRDYCRRVGRYWRFQNGGPHVSSSAGR